MHPTFSLSAVRETSLPSSLGAYVRCTATLFPAPPCRSLRKSDISFKSYRFSLRSLKIWTRKKIFKIYRRAATLFLVHNFEYPMEKLKVGGFIISFKMLCRLDSPSPSSVVRGPSPFAFALPIGLFVIQATAADDGRGGRRVARVENGMSASSIKRKFWKTLPAARPVALAHISHRSNTITPHNATT